jgi:predicted transcriptional regulator
MVTTERKKQEQNETVEVRVESDEDWFDGVRQTMRKLDEGRPDEVEREHSVSLPSEERLNEVLSPKRVELVRATRREEPSSMRELARLVERDIRQVSDDVNELAALGLIELVEEGRAKRPVVPYDEIDIRIPVG